MPSRNQPVTMRRGRPREFDPEAALDQALAVFVHAGYEAASVQQLADAMGICKPSLYAAYGNKDALFSAALRRYAAANDARQAALLESEPDARLAVTRLLDDAATRYTQCRTAPGCLVVAEAAASPVQHSDTVREAIAAAMAHGTVQLRQRLLRAQREGDLDASTDIDELTAYLGTVLMGLSVQARNGASAESLKQVVRMAMRAWPSRVQTAH